MSVTAKGIAFKQKNGLTQAAADRAKHPDGQRRDLTALVLVQEWFGANSRGS
jgi:hypothetical protein